MRLNRIKDVLEEKGISQMWLSKKLCKSFSTVNAYCCNRQQPSLRLLVEIANIHSVSIKDIIIENKVG
jgi:putative transcriptional regulator